MYLVIQRFGVNDPWLALRFMSNCFLSPISALFDREDQWSQGVCAFMCTRVEEHVGTQGVLLSFAHVHSSPLTVQHTRGPGTEWYDIPVPDLLSHYVFVLLYLQTIHRTDLSGKESAPQAWMIASIPGASCSSFGWGFPPCHEDKEAEQQTDVPTALIINPPPVWLERIQSHCKLPS